MVSAKSAELTPSQMKRFAAADLGFHTLLIRLASNPRILKVINDTRLMIRIFGIQRSGHRREELQRIDGHHRQILKAVSKRNSENARALLTEHIQLSARERLEEFDRWEYDKQLAQLHDATSL